MYLLKGGGIYDRPSVDGVDVAIVNTCGLLNLLRRMACQYSAVRAAEAGGQGVRKLMVTGCLSQRYQEEICKEMPEVDGVRGWATSQRYCSGCGALLQGQNHL